MKINSSGHAVNNNGETTNPIKSKFWLGDNNQRIAFEALKLDNGLIAIHSIYGRVDDSRCEDFVYEILAPEEAVEQAISMINSAEAFLISEGVTEMSVHVEGFLDTLN